MPDWSYHTVFKPILFRIPAATARDLALGAMGTLARIPLGSRVISFMGHMAPDARLAAKFCELDFPTPIGLGPWLDVRAKAWPALARFGFGFLDLGRIGAARIDAQISRDDPGQSIAFSQLPAHALDEVQPRIREVSKLSLPLLARVTESDFEKVAKALTGQVSLLAVELASDMDEARCKGALAKAGSLA